MSVRYLKKAEKTAATGEQDVRATVQAILEEIEAGGEAKARDYAAKFDKWEGEIVVSRRGSPGGGAKVPERLKDDIRFAHDQVRRFAEAQKDGHPRYPGGTAARASSPATATSP